MYEGLEEDFATDADLLGHLATSKERLQGFFNTNYAPRSRQSVSRQGSSTSAASSGFLQKVNFTSRYQKKKRVVVSELDEYFKLLQEYFDTCEPLNWWRGRRSPCTITVRCAALHGSFHDNFTFDEEGNVLLCLPHEKAKL
jgi:hypothetical protein